MEQSIMLVVLVGGIVSLIIFVRRRTSPMSFPAASAHQSRIPLGTRALRYSEIENDGQYVETDSFRTKIVGVSHTNADGTRRELIIQTKCSVGDALALVRNPENAYDPNAVAVARIIVRSDGSQGFGEQLGFLSRSRAEEIADDMDQGAVYFAQITALTGDREVDVNGDDDYNAGVNIEVTRFEKADVLRQQVEQLDQRQAQCPSCGQSLPKVPGKKTKCRKCGEFCFIRTRTDGVRVVVTKAEAERIEAEWAARES